VNLASQSSEKWGTPALLALISAGAPFLDRRLERYPWRRPISVGAFFLFSIAYSKKKDCTDLPDDVEASVSCPRRVCCVSSVEVDSNRRDALNYQQDGQSTSS
jgi:hypothetical protein